MIWQSEDGQTVGYQKKPLNKIAGGAYARCFEDLELSSLLSRIQALIIKNGYALERMIIDLITDILIEDLGKFLSVQIMKKGIRVAEKKVIKEWNKIQGHSIEPDFIIFERVESAQKCYIVELKDGYEFDTKSSAKEHTNLNTFLSKNAMALQNFQSYCKICGFNTSSREEIKTGFKNKIALSQAMTGTELCNILNLNYDEIRKARAYDKKENFHQFMTSLTNIDSVKTWIDDNYKNG